MAAVYRMRVPGRRKPVSLVVTVVQERLENEDGRHLVDDLAAAPDAHLSFAQETIGLGGGEALIPKMHGQGKLLAEIAGKGSDFFSLGAGSSAERERQSHDDFANLVLADDLR